MDDVLVSGATPSMHGFLTTTLSHGLRFGFACLSVPLSCLTLFAFFNLARSIDDDDDDDDDNDDDDDDNDNDNDVVYCRC